MVLKREKEREESVMDNQKASNTVVDIAHMMYERRMVTTFEGNVSLRCGDRMYITPTSQCKGDLTEDMVVVLDMAGGIVDGRLRPSSEYRMHLEFYRLRPDITCVVHTHSPYATAFACCRMPIRSRSYFEAIAMFDTIPVADYGLTGSERIFQGIAKYVDETEVMLLANHGVVSYHADPYQAFYQVEAVEAIAKVLAITRTLGGEHPLDPEDMEDLYRLRKETRGRGELKL
jgi:L-fuculose-phosphate aldolase